MSPKTEEFLYFLLWTCDHLARPTFRNLTDSFEEWAYRQGFGRQLAELQRRQLIESEMIAPDERVHRLTESGRMLTLGGRDPVQQWARRWDGRWRMVVFDVPVVENPKRKQLVRCLRARHFGFLQKSVWITPDRLTTERETIAGCSVDTSSLILLEAKPCGGETNAQIAAAAWDFEEINRLYERHLEVLSQSPKLAMLDEASGDRLLRWSALERAAWSEAVAADPLLPAPLLPPDYLGRKAWHKRLTVMGEIARLAKRFTPSMVE